MKKYIKITLFSFFTLLICMGVLVRGIEVLNKNFVFGFDHGREYLMVKEIVDGHHMRLIGTPLGAGSAGIQGIFHGPGYYYFLAIPYILFAGDPYGGVVLMFIFGIAALVTLCILLYRLFGVFGALLGASLLALSPPIIAQSRFIWSPYPSTVFIALAFLFTYLIKRGNKYIFLAAFFSAFVYNFELAIAVPLSITLVVYAILVLKFRDFRKYVALVFGFVLALLPMILFEVRHNFMAVNGLITYLSGGSNAKGHDIGFLSNLSEHFMSFVYNFSGTFPQQGLIHPIILFLIVVFPFLLFIKNEKEKKIKEFYLYLALLPFVTFFVLAFLRNTVYEYYLYHLNIVYILILVYGFLKAIQKKHALFIVSMSLVLSIYAYYGLANNYKMFAYDIKDYGGDAKIKGKIEAIDYIYKDAGKTKFNVLVFSPPIYTYPYDYIFQWYGNSKYGYIPGNEKKGVLYLLIEKDSAKPWSYKGWLETVIKVGTVESEKTLPSGFIVQKRVVK